MANKRMFTLQICDSDAFLDMPLGSQCLYFQLCMRADDDGFIGSPKKIIRIVGAKEDDLKVLIAKKFLLTFDNGVMVIKHWRMHNSLARNRYHETQYLDEKAMLRIKDDNSYSFDEGKPLIEKKCEENTNGAPMPATVVTSDAPHEDKRRATDASTAHSDIDLDIDIDLEKRKKDKKRESTSGAGTKRTRFVKPSIDELEAYRQEKNLNVDTRTFYDFYESKGWLVGKSPMKDWKATMRGWHNRERPRSGTPGSNKFINFQQRGDDLDAMVQQRVLRGFE